MEECVRPVCDADCVSIACKVKGPNRTGAEARRIKVKIRFTAILRESEFPREDIQSQERAEVVCDFIFERSDESPSSKEIREGCQAHGGTRAWHGRAEQGT